MPASQPATPRPTVTAIHRTTDAMRDRLLAAAEELRSLGHHLRPVGPGKRILWPPPDEEVDPGDLPSSAEAAEATVAAISAGEAHGLAIALGVDSARPEPSGGTVISLALDVSATVSRQWEATWGAACDQAGVGDVWAGLARGWVVTTPAGDARYVFDVAVPSVPYARHLLRSLDAMGVDDGPGRWALRIRTSLVVVPPSSPQVDPAGAYRSRPRSSPGAAASIDARSLHGLAWAMQLASAQTSGRDGAPAVNPLTAAVRRVWAEEATDERTGELLKDAGWEQTRAVVEGALRWEHPSGGRLALGGASRPPGSVWVATAGQGLPAGWVSAWDLRKALTGLDDDELAAALVDSGEVERPLLPLVAPSRPRIVVDSAATSSQQATLLGAIRSARHPALPMPLILAHRVGGRVERLVSASVDGGAVRTWSEAAPDRLAIAVAEPVHFTEKGMKVAAFAPPVVHSAFQGALESVDGPAACDILAAHPVLLSDGTVLATPGWHPEHNALLLQPQGDWSEYEVGENLTRDDAATALAWLHQELLGDFPFASAADLARAIAYVLTCSVRDIIPSSPAWMMTATQAGTGKGMLAAVGRIIANGTSRYAAMSAWRATDEESAKRLSAEIIGHPGETHFAHIDELERGGLLTSLLLSETVTSADGATSLRRLGHSQDVSVGGVIVTVTGNNIGVGGDWARRIMPITMRWTGDERPEERGGFRHADLLEWVAENRPAILGACHTIIARGLREGLQPPSRLGSFSRWTEVVIGALSDLHIPSDDPAGRTVAQLALGTLGEWKRENDTTMEGWASLFSWWVREWGTDAVTAGTLSEMLNNRSEEFQSLLNVDIPQQILGQIEAHRDPFARAGGVGKILTGMVGTPVDLEGIGRVRLAMIPSKGHRGRCYRLEASDPDVDLGEFHHPTPPARF